MSKCTSRWGGGKRITCLSSCSLDGEGLSSRKDPHEKNGQEGHDEQEELHVYSLLQSNLLVLSASIHVGRSTIAAKALVDSGASANFISPELAEKVIAASGATGRVTVREKGWMTVRTAGGGAVRAPRRWLTTNIGIGTYGASLNFLIFDGVRDTGFELILGKTWHDSINLRHSIDHVRNVMTIWDKGSRHVLKGSAPPDRRIDEDGVDETPQTDEGYVSGDQKAAEEGLLEEQETPETTETMVRPQEAANPPQSSNSFLIADEEVGDVPPRTPLESPQEQTTGGSSCGLSDQWCEDGLDPFAVDASEHLVDRPNLTTTAFEQGMRRKFPELFMKATGIPPARANDIRLRLVPGSAPLATRPHRLSPPERQELRKQLKKLYGNGGISV